MNANYEMVTCREVERRTGLSHATIYRKIGDGSFPAPVKVGAHAVRWRESDIRAWIDSCPRAQGEKANQQKQRPKPKPKPKPKKRQAQ